MRFRTTLILIAVLAAVVVLIRYLGREEPEVDTRPEPLLPGVDFGAVRRIECAMFLGRTAVLEMQPSGRWKVVAPYDDEASADMVQQILAALSESVRVPVALQDGDVDLASKNLDPPQHYIELHTPAGLSRVNIGARDSLGSEVFVTVGDSPVLYRTGANLLNLMEQNPENFRDTRLFRIDPLVVDCIELKENGEIVMRAERSRGSWEIVEPIRDDADSGRVQNLVYNMARLQVEKIFAAEAGAELLDECGFNEHSYEITLLSGPVARAAVVAPAVLGPGAAVFCQRADSEAILLIRRGEFVHLALDLETYRSRILVPPVREDLRSLTISHRGNVRLSLVRPEGMYFHIDAPFEALADNVLDGTSTPVSDFLDSLFSLQADEIVSEPAASAAAGGSPYGLDDPVWSVVVRWPVGRKVELVFGREEDGHVYARRSDKPRFVYAVRSGDIAFLDKHALELRDRRPFMQDLASVGRAVFVLGDREHVIERAGGRGAFENDPGNRFQELMHDLERVRVVRYLPEPSGGGDPRFADVWGSVRYTIDEPGRGKREIVFEFGSEADGGYHGRSSAIPDGTFILPADFRDRYAQVFEGL